MKKFFALALAALLAATAFAGCGAKTGTSSEGASDTASSEAGTASGETIKIGCLAPLTGEVSTYGIATANGIKLGVEEINKNGGIGGKQIELMIQDEKGDPTEAVNAYNKLVDQGMVALIGDVTSKPCQAVAEVTLQDNMPMLTATGTAADITKPE